MYKISGETLEQDSELELEHLDGHKGQKPVRVGNGAASHLQLVSRLPFVLGFRF